MRLTVDPTRPEPPYEQIREQVRALVAACDVEAGTRLPTVRGLATDLGIAPNTVARAYRELESLGVIETRGRAGSFVSGGGLERAVREAAHTFVDRAHELGLDRDAALIAVRNAWD